MSERKEAATGVVTTDKPTAVRIFWWLAVAMVAYSVFVETRFLVFPSAHHLADVARLPPRERDLLRRADIIAAVIRTTIWDVPTLVLAWFSAFRHANWARWAFAILFLLAVATDFLIAASYHTLPDYFAELGHHDWLSLRQYVLPAIWLAAIGLSFSRNARPWFHRSIRKHGDDS